jgi:hypothetical protein
MAATAIPLASGEITDDRLGTAPVELVGLVQATAGTVVVHDGTDATGPVVLASAGIGTVSLNEAVACHDGVFVVLSGGATGSLFA